MLKLPEKVTTDNSQNQNRTAPLLKNHLKISFIAVVLPLVFLSISGFFFFQKLSNAFDIAIDDIASNIVPITQIKDKVQLSIIAFNRYLENFEPDEINQFIKYSGEIKLFLTDTIKLGNEDNSLTNDLYRTAYLSWRKVNRISLKIMAKVESNTPSIPHQLLHDFYQNIIATTLILDQLHLNMQDRTKINFHKTKQLESQLFLFLGLFLVLVYLATLISIIYLNNSIIKPINLLDKWISERSATSKLKPLELNSYREFERIAENYIKLSKIIRDKDLFLEELTQKDNLTKLYNKRYFIKRLVDEHHRHQRYHTNYCLMLIDVDHLGSVNRSYGEAVCELTLIQIAQLLEEAIRPTDFLAHYESDRFIIILPEVELHGSNMTAERIINSVSETVFNINEFKFGITVSIGFSFAQEELSLSDVLQCVDYSLQQAKLSGRNQAQYCESTKELPFKFKAKYLIDKDFNIH